MLGNNSVKITTLFGIAFTHPGTLGSDAWATAGDRSKQNEDMLLGGNIRKTEQLDQKRDDMAGCLINCALMVDRFVEELAGEITMIGIVGQQGAEQRRHIAGRTMGVVEFRPVHCVNPLEVLGIPHGVGRYVEGHKPLRGQRFRIGIHWTILIRYSLIGLHTQSDQEGSSVLGTHSDIHRPDYRD